ncbi:hypothetical protein QC758_19570 [Halomonas campisalis]|uniref:hypothetical protein n=1 Tax=Billgrantia campisalis TaxID=74661 RepID=UPI001EF0C32F|nr:hypothetical protein [Halomonas campisalis]MDR5865155.1 hypothetical protein [Halomonas campisalis]
MTRKKGAKNITAFDDRAEIATTATKSIRHLSREDDSTPSQQFHATLKNQGNYLKWIDSRHTELQKARNELDPDGRGPKDATYRKYRWYAEQTTLLEAINAFEVFYKNSFIGLACALRRVIPPERIKGAVDAKVLWANQGKTSFPSLIFESQLFHDLEQIDKVSSMLIEAKRYNPNNQASSNRKLVLSLQAIFQIRHTLSHNQGRVTQSDMSKLEMHGYSASLNEVIDPEKNHLGQSIRKRLRSEVNAYTKWLLNNTAKFLERRSRTGDIVLDVKLKKSIEHYVGSNAEISKLDWK